MQVHVGEQRRNRCSLWRPLLRFRQLPVFDDPCGQPLADQPQDLFIRDPVPEEPIEPASVKLAEEVADIRVQHPAHLVLIDPGRQRVQRVMRLSARPEPVRDPGNAPRIRRSALPSALAERSCPPATPPRAGASARPASESAPAAPAWPGTFPNCARPCRSRTLPSRSRPYSSHLTPSVPGAAYCFNDANAARSRSNETWCSNAVNRASLSRTATSRTRTRSCDTPLPALRPGRVSPPVFPHSWLLPFLHRLRTRRPRAAALFGGITGTTR